MTQSKTGSCTICAEITTNQYHSSCCGAWLCSDCFGLLEPDNKVTCGRCGYPVEPVNTTVAISSMIIVATAMTTAAIKLDLAQLRLSIDLVRTTLAELADNTAELHQELNNNSVGVTRAQLRPDQIRHLGQQLETFSTSQTKSIQLKLDQLLNHQKLLSCRLETLTCGVVTDQVRLLTLTKPWSQRLGQSGQLLVKDNCDFNRRVWWRRASRFDTPWQLMPSSTMPRVKQLNQNTRNGDYENNHYGKFFTRLADDKLAVVEVKVNLDQILLTVTALVQWQLDTKSYLTLSLPRIYSAKPDSLGLGVVTTVTTGVATPDQVQGYYCYYSLDRLTLLGIQKLLVVQDFGLDGSLGKSYRITLAARPSQVYRYGNTLLAIVAGRLTVIRLGGETEPVSPQIVSVSAQTNLTISRYDQDQLWLNWNNQEIWQYSFTALAINGLSLVNGQISPLPLSKTAYLGPIDHKGYLEVVLPGLIVYCHYEKQILTTGYGQIYHKNFHSVAVTDSGEICVV